MHPSQVNKYFGSDCPTHGQAGFMPGENSAAGRKLRRLKAAADGSAAGSPAQQAYGRAARQCYENEVWFRREAEIEEKLDAEGGAAARKIARIRALSNSAPFGSPLHEEYASVL